MKMISFDYYFERIIMRYKEKTINNVIKILVRSKKMYETVDLFLLVFQLNSKIEVIILYLFYCRNCPKEMKNRLSMKED